MSRRSQLFVGRLPLDSREREIESLFEKYGSLVRFNLKYGTGMAYAFVDYEDKRDAERNEWLEASADSATRSLLIAKQKQNHFGMRILGGYLLQNEPRK